MAAVAPIWSNDRRTLKKRALPSDRQNENFQTQPPILLPVLVQRALLNPGALTLRDGAQLQCTIGNQAIVRSAVTPLPAEKSSAYRSLQHIIQCAKKHNEGDLRVYSPQPFRQQAGVAQANKISLPSYTQGTKLYIASRQAQHLPHEAWHSMWQRQERTRPTLQAKGGLTRFSLGSRLSVIQRKPVAPSAYLTAIIGSDSGDPEWDPQWTLALNKVAGNSDFTKYTKPMMDDENDHDVHAVLGVLKTLAQLSNDKPNLYKIAIDAVRWHAGIESDSGGSGFGSLDTSAAPFSGRPAFPSLTQTNIPLKSGQHRRHILPWHSIRQFVFLAYSGQKDAVMQTIWKMYNAPPDDAVAQAFAEAIKYVTSGREKSGSGNDVLSDEELLKIGLFVMNGNPRNLWAGKGTTNSAINTAQMHMNKALDSVTTFEEMAQLASDWQEVKGKDIYTTATTLGAQLLNEHGPIAYSLWEQSKDPTKESDFVKPVVDMVRQYVVSNLELDVLGDAKMQTQIAQEKAQALTDPIMLIDNVVTGKVDIKTVDRDFIRNAMTEFLTYIK